MAVTAPPATLTVAELERMALSFDNISDETGARYSAGAFIVWVRRELDARELTQERMRQGRTAGVVTRQLALGRRG